MSKCNNLIEALSVSSLLLNTDARLIWFFGKAGN